MQERGMPMINKLPKFLDNHKICIICEGNEEYEYLDCLNKLNVWKSMYNADYIETLDG